MNPEAIVNKNSEILLLYDAMLTNPNGDPDDENRPRYDYDTQRNLVSDVRLKRYIRDYWISKNLNVYVAKIEGKAVDATQRVQEIITKFENEQDKIDALLGTFIDVRHFGATITIKGKKKTEEKGSSFTFTGPIQFTWGYSLHPTEILSSSTITSQLAGRTEGGKGEHGTMGKDWRIKYSLLGFYGIVSAWRARETKLKEKDVESFDKDIIKAIKLLTSTRSKIGQTPRFYMRIQHKDDETFVGDLREFVDVKVKSEHTPASLDDLKIDMSKLKDLISENEKIEKVYIWVDSQFSEKAQISEITEEEKVETFSV